MPPYAQMMGPAVQTVGASGPPGAFIPGPVGHLHPPMRTVVVLPPPDPGRLRPQPPPLRELQQPPPVVSVSSSRRRGSHKQQQLDEAVELEEMTDTVDALEGQVHEMRVAQQQAAATLNHNVQALNDLVHRLARLAGANDTGEGAEATMAVRDGEAAAGPVQGA